MAPSPIGLGFRVQGLGFRVSGLGFRVSGLGFREMLDYRIMGPDLKGGNGLSKVRRPFPPKAFLNPET